MNVNMKQKLKKKIVENRRFAKKHPGSAPGNSKRGFPEPEIPVFHHNSGKRIIPPTSGSRPCHTGAAAAPSSGW
jgi:hypothetical protein